MSSIYCPKTRRQFLVGAGKSLLALPLLPSMLPSEAFAQTVSAPRRMMLFWFDHGSLTSMWPQRSIATQSVGSSGARQIPLRTISRANISSIFSNSRYEAIKNANLMTILRGFDLAVPYGSAHGNYTMAAGAGASSQGNHPTIDSVIERSSSVYPSSTPLSVRRAIRASLQEASLFYDKVGTRVHGNTYYGPRTDILRFYDEVFSSLTGGTAPPVDTTNQVKVGILNRVHESFTSFRNSRRISADDRAQLDRHMDHISDIQRSLATIQPPPAMTCSRPNRPGRESTVEGNNQLEIYANDSMARAYLDLMALALKCGLTKFAVMYLDAHNPLWIPGLVAHMPGAPDFHHVVHGNDGAQRQISAHTHWWTYYVNLIADNFLSHLQDIEGNTGRSYMENMITGMLCVGGIHSAGNDGGHAGYDSQQILLGSMGGLMQSGNYVAMPESGGRRLPYNCFLLTLLHLMGVPPSEYAYATSDGNGIGYYDFGSNHPYRGRFYQPVSEILT